MQRLEKLENENKALRSLITQLESRVAALEVGSGAPAAAKPAEAAKVYSTHQKYSSALIFAIFASWGSLF